MFVMMRSRTPVRVSTSFYCGWDDGQAAVSNPPLGHDAFGESFDLGSWPSQYRHFHGTVVVERNAHGRNRQIMAMLKSVCEPLRQIARFPVKHVRQACDAFA
jgi:hypothetical protein